MKRRYLGAGIGLLLCVAVGAALSYTPRLEGRYETVGKNVLADGSTLSSYHSIVFSGERFYAITRIGPSQVESSGAVNYRPFKGHQLKVEHSQTQGDPAALEESLRFTLLYARHLGATLQLLPAAGCLYSPQTQQLYCHNAPL